MATAGEKLVRVVFGRSRLFIPGLNLDQAAQQLVVNNKDYFIGMKTCDARQLVVDALKVKMDSGELVKCRAVRGKSRKPGYRKPTKNELKHAAERNKRRTAREAARRRPSIRKRKRLVVEGRAAKQWAPQAA